MRRLQAMQVIGVESLIGRELVREVSNNGFGL